MQKVSVLLRSTSQGLPGPQCAYCRCQPQAALPPHVGTCSPSNVAWTQLQSGFVVSSQICL